MANYEMITNIPEGLKRIKRGFVANGIHDRVTRIGDISVQPTIIVDNPNTSAETSRTEFRPVRTPNMQAK